MPPLPPVPAPPVGAPATVCSPPVGSVGAAPASALAPPVGVRSLAVPPVELPDAASASCRVLAPPQPRLSPTINSPTCQSRDVNLLLKATFAPGRSSMPLPPFIGNRSYGSESTKREARSTTPPTVSCSGTPSVAVASCWTAIGAVLACGVPRSQTLGWASGTHDSAMRRAIISIGGTVVGLLLGGFVGVFGAGNCATNLRVGSQAGYEVGAWGGALLGAVLGCLIGLRLGRRRAV